MEPLSPPPELRKQWINESPGIALDGHTRVGTDWNAVMDKAAAWGADQAVASDGSVIATITSVTIHNRDQNFSYGEGGIELRMVDETGGAFFELRQEDVGPIRTDLADLEVLACQARRLLQQPVFGHD